MPSSGPPPGGAPALARAVRPSIALAACAVGVLLVGLVDYQTGWEVRIYPVYFVPVVVGSQVAGRRAGVALAALSSAVWLGSNMAAGLTASAPWIPYFNALVQLVGFTAVALLAARQRAWLLRERGLSRRDALTQLPNARALREHAEQEIDRMRRDGGTLVVAFLDLDHFKAVNDGHGHAAGDEVLRLAARALTGALRATDLVARLGGDEFVVLMPGAKADAARLVLERIRAALRDAMKARDWPVTASIGAVVFRAPPASVDAMLAVADAAMYRLKAAGRDRVRVVEAGEAGEAEQERAAG